MMELVASTAVGVLGWASLRLVGKVDRIHDKIEDMDRRLVRVETSLTNDIRHSLAELRSEIRRGPPAPPPSRENVSEP